MTTFSLTTNPGVDATTNNLYTYITNDALHLAVATAQASGLESTTCSPEEDCDLFMSASVFHRVKQVDLWCINAVCCNEYCDTHSWVYQRLASIRSAEIYSLVDGGGLRTFFCDPMHMLRSSGYALSGIYIDDLRMSPRIKFILSRIQTHGFRPVCTPSQKKLF